MWLVTDAMGNSHTMTFGRVVIRAGSANPRHRHPYCDEILHLISGRLEHLRITRGNRSHAAKFGALSPSFGLDVGGGKHLFEAHPDEFSVLRAGLLSQAHFFD